MSRRLEQSSIKLGDPGLSSFLGSDPQTILRNQNMPFMEFLVRVSYAYFDGFLSIEVKLFCTGAALLTYWLVPTNPVVVHHRHQQTHTLYPFQWNIKGQAFVIIRI